MKNILIPTDFSENAWNATRYAIELFKNEECVFHLLNTYTPAIASSRFMAAAVDGGALENSAQLHSKRGLKHIIERINLEYDNPKHSFQSSSSFSFLVDEIKEIIAKKNIDLIVAGTKGASALKRFLWGAILFVL